MDLRDESTPAAPAISIDDVTQAEGDSGTTDFVFTVSADEEVIGGGFSYATVAGTATSPDDFVATSGTTSFGIFGSSTTVTVTVNSDTSPEPDETFTLVLSDPFGVTITDGTGLGTIVSDEATPPEADISVSVEDEPDPVQVGAELTYLVTVRNAAGGVSSEVELSNDLPNDVVLVSAIPSTGTCEDGSTVVCDLGELASGASATVDIVVVPTRTGFIANQAGVTGSATDPDETDNGITTITEVIAAPNGCTVIGTAGDDVLVGTPGDDIICGYGGDDTLSGNDGDDELRGGSGDDTLLGGYGYDRLQGSGGRDTLAGGEDVDSLDGGGGYDTLSYDGNAGFVYVNLADGYAVEDNGCSVADRCASGGETLASVAAVIGSPYADTIEGDGGPNKLFGGAGNDVLSGRDAHDTLDGGADSDSLDGGRARDTCTTGETLTHCES